MLKKFATKYLFNSGKFILPIIAIIFIYSTKVNCQLNTNLDVFYSLTDSLVDKINSEIPSTEKKILLTLNLGQNYTLFSNNIVERFKKDGKRNSIPASG